MSIKVLIIPISFRNGRGSGCLECVCQVLNINRGHNRELMEKCRRLKEYSEFTSEIDDKINEGMSLSEAVGCAIDYCIEHDILKDILVRERAEVQKMLLTEYDEKKHFKMLLREGREEGIQEGREEGIRALAETCLEMGMSRQECSAKI